VVKRDQAREPYNREKVERGIWRALEKRKVSEERVAQVISDLEEEWMTIGSEVPSSTIGESILKSLKGLDEVAYIRFASVYRDFQDVENFKNFLKEFKK